MIKRYKIKKFRRINTGYTIIETMIAVSLFIIIVMAGMGALLNANLLHQKSQNMRSIMDSLSFMMEDMGRNLRTGYKYHCLTGNDNLSNVTIPLSCANGWGIAFESQNGSSVNNNDQWVYYIDNTGKIFKSTQGPYNDIINHPYTQLTPDEVKIDSISGFSVLGAESIATNSQQPFVSIRLVGTITFKNVITPFSLQTSVSQRLIDI